MNYSTHISIIELAHKASCWSKELRETIRALLNLWPSWMLRFKLFLSKWNIHLFSPISKYKFTGGWNFKIFEKTLGSTAIFQVFH